MKAEKCEFLSLSVTFLGYIIAQGSIQMDPRKVSVMLDWPTPDSRKKLQQFIVFTSIATIETIALWPHPSTTSLVPRDLFPGLQRPTLLS